RQTEMVESRVNETQVMPGLLVSNRGDCGPLRRSCTGSSEQPPAALKVNQHAVINRSVVGNVGGSALFSTIDRALLIDGLIVNNAIPASGRLATNRSLIPDDLALVGAGSGILSWIAAELRQAITCRVQLGATDRGYQRVSRRGRCRLDEGLSVAGPLGRTIVSSRSEDGDVLRGCVCKHLVLLTQE